MTSGTVFTAAGQERSVLAALCTVLHDQGLLEGFRRDFLATCVEDRPTCEREHANLRPIADVFGRGEPLIELPAVR